VRGAISPAVLLLAAALSAAWLPQQSGSTAELRGLSVLDATHAWVSGSGGTVLRLAGSERWEGLAVPGGEELDFRDVEALSRDAVVLMSAGPGDRSRIYRSADGGRTWALTHTNPDAGGFYDAVAFWDERNGILVGDPVGGRFVVRVTDDGGTRWAAPSGIAMPEALPGEGAFAASGTCLFALAGGLDAWFVTGGARPARVFHTKDRGRTWSVAATPLLPANASSGLFSVVFLDARHGVAVGGDYKEAKSAASNGVGTEDGGATWAPAPVAPTGYYSAVAAKPGATEELFAVGLTGTAESRDGGRTWMVLDGTPLNAVAFGRDGSGFAVGPKGAIARLVAGR
jgi:photosystem II stability/assembly factor-like uncharacterized protein